jgi:hypothetical protein
MMSVDGLSASERHLLGEVFKALNTAAFVTACAIWGFYLPALVRGLRQRPVSRAWFLILGILLTWAGIAVLYGATGFLQWFHFVDPLASPTPVPIRLIYLVLALAGGAIHVSAAYREKFGVARTFLLWCAGVALACVLMIVLAD